ncbi:hypothetical protein LCGC14_1984130, partial [marine sediment metagenome]
ALYIRTHAIFCSAMKKGVWEKIGGFQNYRAAEDRIFIEKILAGAYQVAYTDKAVAHLELRSSLKQTFQRFSNYSRHNLRAGREKHWHWPVLRNYIVVGIFAALAVYVHWVWWFMTFGWLMGRTIKSMRAYGEGFKPKVFLTVFGIKTANDIATLNGFFTWVFVDRCRRGEGH